MAPEDGGTWRFEHTLPRALQEYRWFFDPEGKEGRLARLCRAIIGSPALQVAGGFVPTSEIAASLGMDEALAEQVLSRVVAADPRFSVVEVDGVAILKHLRV